METLLFIAESLKQAALIDSPIYIASLFDVYKLV